MQSHTRGKCASIGGCSMSTPDHERELGKFLYAHARLLRQVEYETGANANPGTKREPEELILDSEVSASIFSNETFSTYQTMPYEGKLVLLSAEKAHGLPTGQAVFDLTNIHAHYGNNYGSVKY